MSEEESKKEGAWSKCCPRIEDPAVYKLTQTIIRVNPNVRDCKELEIGDLGTDEKPRGRG